MASEDIPAPSFDAQINVKLSRELKARLRKIEAKHGTPAPEVLRRLGAAAADFFDRNGYLTFPVTITPEIFTPPSSTKAKSGTPAKKPGP